MCIDIQGSYGANMYDVDLVLCIDGTRSMQPIIETTKKNARNLPDDILKEARAQEKHIAHLRMRLIVFRDYLADGEYAMQMTPFYDLPQETEDMNAMISEIIASGGGDEPEDALEALAYAMDSDWQPQRQGARRRQIIALWTDASAHELGFGKQTRYYDPRLPKDFEELTSRWGDNEEPESKMHYYSKRMALFAPAVKPWTVLGSSWDNVIHYPSVAAEGLGEHDYHQIIHLLVRTI